MKNIHDEAPDYKVSCNLLILPLSLVASALQKHAYWHDQSSKSGIIAGDVIYL
jgi:hypothetical protein